VVANDRESGTTRGWQVEQRYRIGEFRPKQLLPALYAEVSHLAGQPYEVEGRLIGTCIPSPEWILSGNAVLNHALEPGAPVEWGYSLGAAKIRGHAWIGVEAFGSLSDRFHWIGPNAGIEISERCRLLGTFAFPLNRQQAQAKVLFAVEF
jgi:hypothetical protein